MPLSSSEWPANPAEATVPFSVRETCIACGAADLERLIELPRLPITGVFVDPDASREHLPQDQAFLRCETCGHGQLERSLDPDYLYRETYTHRSSFSRISIDGNHSFLEFVCGIEPDRQYQHCVEVGCNDLILLRQLRPRVQESTGFDPIWNTAAPPKEPGIRVVGKYIEEIQPMADLAVRPDLVVSIHTFEHVHDPLPHLSRIVAHATADALVVIEVPSLDTLVHTARFDQIFHQHLNYFTLESLVRMATRMDLEYVSHRYNYRYWLGTMAVAFRKRRGAVAAAVPARSPTREAVLGQFATFRTMLRFLDSTLESLRERRVPIYGYGAAQMVPVLGYHMHFSLDALEAIIDDDERKAGRTYPGMSVRISPLPPADRIEAAAVLVTALDSTRPILSRLLSLAPRYIINPLQLF
jgi:hypothetical protein